MLDDPVARFCSVPSEFDRAPTLYYKDAHVDTEGTEGDFYTVEEAAIVPRLGVAKVRNSPVGTLM